MIRFAGKPSGKSNSLVHKDLIFKMLQSNCKRVLTQAVFLMYLMLNEGC